MIRQSQPVYKTTECAQLLPRYDVTNPTLHLIDWTLAMVPATNRDAGSGPVVPTTAGQARAAAVIAKLDKNTSRLDILEDTIKELTDDRRDQLRQITMLGQTVKRLEDQLMALESRNNTLAEELSQIRGRLDNNGGGSQLEVHLQRFGHI